MSCLWGCGVSDRTAPGVEDRSVAMACASTGVVVEEMSVGELARLIVRGGAFTDADAVRVADAYLSVSASDTGEPA